MKKILGLLTALMITLQAHASIAVAPTRIEIDANKLKTNYVTTAIEVRGDSKQPMRFRVYPGYFTINSNGEMNMDAPSDEHDISKKIRYVPSEFNVMPGKTQKLRVNIAGISSLPDGESRAVLYLEDVNAKEFQVDTGMTGIGAQLIVKTRIGVPVYVDKGKFTRKGEIESFRVTKDGNRLLADMTIASTGNSKLRCNGKVQLAQGKKLLHEAQLAEKVISANGTLTSRDIIEMDNFTEKGEFTLRVVLSYVDENGKKQNMIKETLINL